MKKAIFIIAVLILFASNLFASDVSIDSSGNVTVGVSNTNANLEVTGSDEDGIVSTTSGTGKAGPHGDGAEEGAVDRVDFNVLVTQVEHDAFDIVGPLDILG